MGNNKKRTKGRPFMYVPKTEERLYLMGIGAKDKNGREKKITIKKMVTKTRKIDLPL